jgi:serine/threonine-protein kinase
LFERAIGRKQTLPAVEFDPKSAAPEPRPSPGGAMAKTQLELREVETKRLVSSRAAAAASAAETLEPGRVRVTAPRPDDRVRVTGSRASEMNTADRARVTAPHTAPTPAPEAMVPTLLPDGPNPWGEEGAGPSDPTKRADPPPKTQLEAPAAQDPLIGTQLGEYRVKSLLGSGGMGIVYRGEQPEIGKQVAIKVLRPELASDPRQVQRLRDEARAVNAVHHPGLINIFSFGETPEGAKYFVMDLLEGQSLEEFLAARGGKVKTWEALPILEGALSALDAAHGAGVIHRDLKPSNIFLVDLPDHTHLVKLLDFGLAKLNLERGPSRSPQTVNVVVGTPEYMSPEQARAIAVSPRTDLYAMGIVAYEMLTGNVPFCCESPVQTLMMQVEVVPKLVGELEPSIPEPLEKLIARLLEKLPEDRPASASEVKRELGRIKHQLTNAETQIAAPVEPPAQTVDPSVADTLLPGQAFAPSHSSERPAPAAGANRLDTDVEANLAAAGFQQVGLGAGGLKAWRVPAVAGAASLAVLGLVFFALARHSPAASEPMVVVPPPAAPVVHPPAPAPEADLDPLPAPPPRLQLKRPEPAHAQRHAKGDVTARMDSLVERARKSENPQVTRLVQQLVPMLRKQVDSGEKTPDQVWRELDTIEPQVR